MKTAFVCAFVLLAVAYSCNAQTVCDPDANGMPSCTADVASTATFRNNWDPTHYWVCSNGQAQQVQCPTATLYDPTSETCISWVDWQWQNPCPITSSN